MFSDFTYQFDNLRPGEGLDIDLLSASESRAKRVTSGKWGMTSGASDECGESHVCSMI